MRFKFVICMAMLMQLCYLARAQWNCATAVQDEGNQNLMLPPVGTVAAPGPDYGCLTQFSRPVWGYFISCDTTTFQPMFDPDPNTGNVYYSIVIWGPFFDQDYACNNLTSGNIYHCEDMVQFTGWIYQVGTIINALPGALYYYMLTTSDSAASNNYVPIHYIQQQITAGGPPKPCYVCNDEVSLLLRRDICLVSFDCASQKTLITWEKLSNSGTDGYVIYRGQQGMPQMDSVGWVTDDLPGEFIDYTSNPQQYAEDYRLVPVDSCGNRHNYWDYFPHAACYLQVTPAGNNTANLNWNQLYLMQTGFEPFQYIHRGTTSQNMQIIDTIPLNVTAYTDITAPPGQIYYAIERRKLTACNPFRISSGTPGVSSMSNTAGVMITGIPVVSYDDLISVHPVPASDRLHLSGFNSLSGCKITITDTRGGMVMTRFAHQDEMDLDVSRLAAGTYWLNVTGGMNVIKKFIIER